MRFSHDLKLPIARLLLPAALALILLFVPLFLLFAQQDPFLPLEKQYRAEMPAFNKDAFFSGAWTGSAEEFLADRMPGRSVLLGVYNYADKLSGKQNAKSIFETKTGALVEAPCVRDDDGLAARLNTIRSFSEGVDCPVSLLIVPTAGYCAGEDLNALARACYFDDKVLEKAKSALSGSVQVIDLLPAFTAADELLYYPTDHHWNARGAYLAYMQICANFGLDPLPEQAFIKSFYTGFYGTTYSRSGLWHKEADIIELWDSETPVQVAFSDKDQVFDSMFFLEHLSAQSPDKYPVYLDSNHPLTVIDNLENDGGQTLLIIKDSYANALAPLLIPHYDRIVMVDLRYYKQDIAQVISDYAVTQTLVVYSVENMVHSTDLLFLWLK